MKMSEEVKNLLIEVADYFYFKGLDDEVGELTDKIDIEQALKDYLFDNHIHLYP